MHAHLIFAIAVFAIASVLHGVTGIGFPIMTTAALALFMPLKSAILITLFPTLIINVLSFLSGHKASDVIRSSAPLALSSTVGSLLGVQLLFWVQQSYLLLVLALATFFYVYSAVFREAKIASPSRGGTLAYGMLAGLVGGPTNAMSPVLMMFLLSTSEDKNTISQSANLCFLLGKLSQLVIFSLYGEALFEPKLLSMTLGLTLISVIFLNVGFALRRRISVVRFKHIIIIVLALLAVSLSVKAVTHLLGPF